MRPLLTALALATVGVLLAGCTEAATPPPSPRPTPALSSAAPETSGESVLALIGDWRISEAVGEESGTMVRLGPGSLEIWRTCGDVTGSWVANSTTLRAVINGYNQECHPLPPATWLEEAESYEASDTAVTVFAADGSALATLEPVAPGELPAERVLSTEDLDSLDRRALQLFVGNELPEDLQVPADEDLLGRWAPPGRFDSDPHVEFFRDRWTGTDGCNENGGRWVLSADGSFASTTGYSSLVGCDGEAVPTWVMQARTAGLDGDELVLLDDYGNELGRLIRD